MSHNSPWPQLCVDACLSPSCAPKCRPRHMLDLPAVQVPLLPGSTAQDGEIKSLRACGAASRVCHPLHTLHVEGLPQIRRQHVTAGVSFQVVLIFFCSRCDSTMFWQFVDVGVWSCAPSPSDSFLVRLCCFGRVGPSGMTVRPLVVTRGQGCKQREVSQAVNIHLQPALRDGAFFFSSFGKSPNGQWWSLIKSRLSSECPHHASLTVTVCVTATFIVEEQTAPCLTEHQRLPVRVWSDEL